MLFISFIFLLSLLLKSCWLKYEDSDYNTGKLNPGTCWKQFLFTNSVFNINTIALIAMAAEMSIMDKALVN